MGLYRGVLIPEGAGSIGFCLFLQDDTLYPLPTLSQERAAPPLATTIVSGISLNRAIRSSINY
jgi:hypothetical protein